ncbi:hypothetical protein [Streptomyces sp. AC550_RSS872]|uniref:hypothetical protein n=1 Tax=Streptomyces sp. AC550_RSS872 TaxID=2823689 RepID=UPI001C260023|nr:hypothetical protein [Streptomyces sp. AC550_RSS872]
MTALLDTRRALEEQVTALGDRVEKSRREITDTVTSQVSDLHADNRETRNRVNSASTSLSEINRSLPGLRQEVADLSHAVQELRTAVGDLFSRLPEAFASPSSPGADNAPHGQALPLEGPGRDAHGNDGFAPEPDTTASTHEDADTGGTAVSPSSDRPAEAGPQDAAQRRAATEAAATAHPDAAPEAEPGAAPPRDSSDLNGELARHDNVLATAATAGTVHLVCHRDMWDFVQEHAADIPHFRAPAAPSEEGHDRLRITLSGRSVIGVLIAMRDTQLKSAKYGKDDGTWALSGAVYKRLAHDLTTTSRSGTQPLTVIFDDGISIPAEPQS